MIGRFYVYQVTPAELVRVPSSLKYQINDGISEVLVTCGLGLFQYHINNWAGPINLKVKPTVTSIGRLLI